MAFFDELGKKVSKVGRNTIQKTKDYTDVTRLNAQIAEEEKKINNCYYQIGKLYISLHGADYEEQFTGMVRLLCEGDSKIKELRQQIMDIKGLCRCEKCGAEVPVGNAFCNLCGNKMPVQFDESKMRCESCGQLVEKGTRFCVHCGKPLSVLVAPTQPASEIAPAEETEPVEPEEIPVAPVCKPCCTVCGAEMAEGSNFCTQCGAQR